MSKKRPPLNDINNNPGLIHLGAIPDQSPVASFNLPGVENLINTKGFIGFHYRHALNPNKEQENGPADPGLQVNYRGLRYYNPRPLYHVPRNYMLEDILTAQAIFQQGSVLMNISGKYADSQLDKSDQTHIRSHDLLIFPSLTDMTQQTFTHNPTGPQRLQYKVKSVDLLFDDERDYNCDEDFVVTEDGHIKWIGRRPDPGAVMSITYYFTPIYIVKNKIHSLRVIPTNDAGHGALPREAAYAPQQFVCVPSTLVEEANILDWNEKLPPLPDYPASKNTTGGSV